MITIDGTGWACDDCIQLIANGEAPVDYAPADLAEYLGRFEQRTAGLHVVPGGAPHRARWEGCTLDTAGECDCDYIAFAAGACDVCAGNYGGARHAVTFFAAS
jgi:hypothetical protein